MRARKLLPLLAALVLVHGALALSLEEQQVVCGKQSSCSRCSQVSFCGWCPQQSSCYSSATSTCNLQRQCTEQVVTAVPDEISPAVHPTSPFASEIHPLTETVDAEEVPSLQQYLLQDAAIKLARSCGVPPCSELSDLEPRSFSSSSSASPISSLPGPVPSSFVPSGSFSSNSFVYAPLSEFMSESSRPAGSRSESSFFDPFKGSESSVPFGSSRSVSSLWSASESSSFAAPSPSLSSSDARRLGELLNRLEAMENKLDSRIDSVATANRAVSSVATRVSELKAQAQKSESNADTLLQQVATGREQTTSGWDTVKAEVQKELSTQQQQLKAAEAATKRLADLSAKVGRIEDKNYRKEKAESVWARERLVTPSDRLQTLEEKIAILEGVIFQRKLPAILPLLAQLVPGTPSLQQQLESRNRGQTIQEKREEQQTLSRHLEDKRAEYNDAIRLLDERRAQLEADRRSVEQTTLEVKAAKTRLELEQQEAALTATKADRTRSELKKYEANLRTLQHQVREAQSRQDKLQTQVALDSQSGAGSLSRVAQDIINRDSVTRRLEDMQSEARKLQRRVDDTEQTLRRLTARQEEARAAILSAQSRLDAATAAEKRAAIAIEARKKDVSVTEERTLTLKSEMVHLSDRVEEVRLELRHEQQSKLSEAFASSQGSLSPAVQTQSKSALVSAALEKVSTDESELRKAKRELQESKSVFEASKSMLQSQIAELKVAVHELKSVRSEESQTAHSLASKKQIIGSLEGKEGSESSLEEERSEAQRLSSQLESTEQEKKLLMERVKERQDAVKAALKSQEESSAEVKKAESRVKALKSEEQKDSKQAILSLAAQSESSLSTISQLSSESSLIRQLLSESGMGSSIGSIGVSESSSALNALLESSQSENSGPFGSIASASLSSSISRILESSETASGDSGQPLTPPFTSRDSSESSIIWASHSQSSLDAECARILSESSESSEESSESSITAKLKRLAHELKRQQCIKRRNSQV